MENFTNQKSCCPKSDSKTDKKGILAGILYGLVPHTFCIAFIIFSVIGSVTTITFFKKFLLNPYFFHILVSLSIVFATISAVIYLKRNNILSIKGIKIKWRYLSILYGTTIFVNLLLFMVILPVVANLNSGLNLRTTLINALGGGESLQLADSQSSITLQVAIPCPGHAPLITEELKKISGVENIAFRFPNEFEVSYDSTKTSKEQILSLDVFDTYPATVVAEKTNQINNLQSLNNPEQSRSNISSSATGCGCGCGSCQRK